MLRRLLTQSGAAAAQMARAAPVSASHSYSRALATASVGLRPAYPDVGANPSPEQIIKAFDDYMKGNALSSDQTFMGGFKEAIGKYGWYPFVGLGTAALVTKEVFLLNTEFLVLTNFSTLAFIGYVMLSDKVAEFFTDYRKDVVKEFDGLYEAKADLLRAQIEIAQSRVNLPSVVTETHKLFKEANEVAAKARDIAAKVSFRETMMARLRQIKMSEDEAAHQKREALRTQSLQYVLDQIRTSQTVRSSVLKEAVSLVGATEDKAGQFAALNNLITEFAKSKKTTQ